jgi:hypothetical protein
MLDPRQPNIRLSIEKRIKFYLKMMKRGPRRLRAQAPAAGRLAAAMATISARRRPRRDRLERNNKE